MQPSFQTTHSLTDAAIKSMPDFRLRSLLPRLIPARHLPSHASKPRRRALRRAARAALAHDAGVAPALARRVLRAPSLDWHSWRRRRDKSRDAERGGQRGGEVEGRAGHAAQLRARCGVAEGACMTHGRGFAKNSEIAARPSPALPGKVPCGAGRMGCGKAARRFVKERPGVGASRRGL